MGLPLLALSLGIALVASLAVGAARLPVGEVIATLAGRGDDTSRAIILDLRLPRAVLGTLVGAALALSGAAFQALLRNPLAEPYVLGVSGGAALGATAAIALGVGVGWVGALVTPAAAFAGGMAATALVYFVARRAARGPSGATMLLAGVMVNSIAAALITFGKLLVSPATAKNMLRWLVG